MPMRNVLVTGASGFIGGHLVDRLLADGVAGTALVLGLGIASGRFRVYSLLLPDGQVERVLRFAHPAFQAGVNS